MLQPALVLPEALWQGGQGIALAEEPAQARQARQLAWQLRQGHAAHVQELQLLQRADVAWNLLDGVVAARSTRLSANDPCSVLLFRVRPCQVPGPQAIPRIPAPSDDEVC